MSTPDIHTAPLPDLYALVDRSLTLAQLCHAFDERLRDGRAGEVAAFLRDCEERCLNRMHHLDGDEAPWKIDSERWLTFARLTVPRGHVLGGPRDEAGSAELTAQVRILADQWLAHARAAQLPGYKGIGLVVGELLPWLSYPGMPYAQVVQTLDWVLQLREEGGFGMRPEYRSSWKSLIAALDEADLLRYAAHGGKLFDDIADHYSRVRLPELAPGQGWKAWLPFFAQHPALYDKAPIDDLDLLAQRWPGAGGEQREKLASILIAHIGYAEEAADLASARALFDRLVTQDATPFANRLRESGRYEISVALARCVVEAGHGPLLPLLLPAIAQRCEYEDEARDYRDIARRLVSSRPADLASVPVKDLCRLLPLLDAASLQAALTVLTPIIAGSSAKALRASLASLAGHIEPAWLVAAGWMNKPAKNLLLACRDVLLAHPDAAAAPLLADMLAAGKLDAASASTVEQRLRQLGAALPAAAAAAGADAPAGGTPAAEPGWQAQVAAVKRLSTAIKPFDTPELLALCASLDEHAARVLLHLAAIAEGGLPPLARQLLGQLPAENRARLALALVQQWIAADGDPRQRWALQLLAGSADDRVVDVLVAAVQAWNRPRLQRAAMAVEQLGEVDSLYALLRVQELSESRSLKDQVLRGARAALRAAALRRQMSVSELFDELTPDFGLAEGLVLMVGPHSYRVQLQGDLSLRVINEKGKAGKSIPAVKDEALKADWEAAAAQLKTLTASLRNVVKQQGPRMLAALVSGKRWPLDRWRRIFVAHPLLRIVGRSLIWRAEDAPALARTSFRLAEDFSLLDVEDEAVVLPEGCSLSLWHPATAEAGEREAWRAHFADYELEALVDQLDACAELPAAAQFKDGALLPPAPLTLAQEQLGGLLKKFGYRAGPVGDGPSINEHVWQLPALQLCIELAHGHYPPYLDLGLPVQLECLRVRDRTKDYWAWSDAAELPRPLLATLQGQWLALAGKAQAAA